MGAIREDGNEPPGIEHVLVATLVEDFQFYPRQKVDSVNVADIARALTSGVEIPPIIVERKTRRVVDGFHRCRAFVRVFGKTALIPVLWVEYETEDQMYLDSISRNSGHGMRLSRQDQIRCALRAEELGIPTQKIAIALRVLPTRIVELQHKIVIVEGEKIPVKPVAIHLQGREITTGQAEAMKRFGGLKLRQHLRQLKEALEGDLWDRTDSELVEGLHALARWIEEHIPREAPAEPAPA